MIELLAGGEALEADALVKAVESAYAYHDALDEIEGYRTGFLKESLLTRQLREALDLLREAEELNAGADTGGSDVVDDVQQG